MQEEDGVAKWHIFPCLLLFCHPLWVPGFVSAQAVELWVCGFVIPTRSSKSVGSQAFPWRKMVMLRANDLRCFDSLSSNGTWLNIIVAFVAS